MAKVRIKAKSTELTTGPLKSHIMRIALPLSIGFFFNTMYNVVDSFYAGQISTEALAALALSFPVYFIIVAVSEGIARGASALVANAIGAKDEEREKSYGSQVFSLAIFCAMSLTLIGLLAAEPLFRVLGASGDYLQLATDYIHPLFIGAIFFLLNSMSNAILLANGDSKTFSKVLIVGFFLNLMLDPWFLYGGFGLPAMGIKGIAWATVLVQMLGSSYMFMTVVRRGHLDDTVFADFIPKLKVYGEILKQGIPTSFNMMSVALGFFVTTFYLKFYGEESVAAFGIGTRIEQLILLPAIGLGSAIISIVGQNNGAGEMARVQECVRICARYGLYLITSASLLMFLLAKPLVSVFTSDPEVVSIGVNYVRIITFTQWAYVMSFIYIGFLQAVKRPMYGFAESVTRKVVLPLGVFYVVVHVFDVNLSGFWWSMVAINSAVAIVTIGYARHVLKNKLAAA